MLFRSLRTLVPELVPLTKIAVTDFGALSAHSPKSPAAKPAAAGELRHSREVDLERVRAAFQSAPWVRNALVKLKDGGVWIAGTSDHKASQSLYQAKLTGPLAIVLGALAAITGWQTIVIWTAALRWGTGVDYYRWGSRGWKTRAARGLETTTACCYVQFGWIPIAAYPGQSVNPVNRFRSEGKNIMALVFAWGIAIGCHPETLFPTLAPAQRRERETAA